MAKRTQVELFCCIKLLERLLSRPMILTHVIAENRIVYD
jgi:hypothetical protein